VAIIDTVISYSVVNSIIFQPSLIFVFKATKLALKWSPVRGSSLASKYCTRLEVTNIVAYYDKSAITGVKSFIV
jgi:hypothetical protein